jgi:PIN domain nuclease of toxin-antitoxin system
MKPRFLIDTHVLLWWFFGDQRLSKKAGETIRSPGHEILVSSASAWEISTKFRLGKLPHAAVVIQQFPSLLKKGRMEVLAISVDHALEAGGLPGPHRDPFDRMLIAQACLEDIPLVSSDPIFSSYPVSIIW